MGIQGGGQQGGLTEGGGGGAESKVCPHTTTNKKTKVKANRFIFNRIRVNILLKYLKTKTIYLLKSTIFVSR